VHLTLPGTQRRRAALGRLGAFALGLLFGGGSALAQPRHGSELPRLDDLRQLAAQARRERVPVLLFFSTPGCPYCAQARREYLGPLHAQGRAAGVLIREAEITGSRTFIDLDGKPMRESALADRFNVKMVPHVELLDAELKPLGKPLIGIDAAGFYGDYLRDAIATATTQLGHSVHSPPLPAPAKAR
jgi:thiol-disulfide isomerase/thioredoxin